METANSTDKERFLRFFLTIDTDDNGFIDYDELLAYCKERNLDESYVRKWLEMFDKNEDRKISLEEFCIGFGLKMSDMVQEKKDMKIAETEDLNLSPDVTVLSTSMNGHKLYLIIKKYIELVSDRMLSSTEMNDVTAEFKRHLDDKYGRTWQVIIHTGSYSMNYSHDPFNSVQFKYNQHIVLAWRTSV